MGFRGNNAQKAGNELGLYSKQKYDILNTLLDIWENVTSFLLKYAPSSLSSFDWIKSLDNRDRIVKVVLVDAKT